MPWTVRENDGRFCVVKKSDNKSVGCHDSREDAMAQVRALYAAEPDMAARVAEYARERDVNSPGGGHDLRNYWVRGEGAVKIRWGTDGSFNRCVAQLGKHVKNPQGLCAEYHKAATGEWPAEKGVESSVSGLEEFHGTHRQEDHGNWARNGNGNGGSTSIPSYDSMTDATEVVDRLKSSGAINRTDVEWTGSPDADPDNEVIGIINEWINEETNEDSAVGRLQDLGIDPHEIDLDYLATLVEQARSGGTEMHGAMQTFHGNHNQQDHNPHLRKKIDSILDKVGKRIKAKRRDHIGEFDDDDDPAEVAARQVQRERLDDLEEKAEGLGLSGNEREELRKLRRLFGRHPGTGRKAINKEYPSEYDFNLTAASKKRKMKTYADEPWEGTLVVEGTESGDGRLFALGSLDWAQLPLPLMFQPANSGGHQESIMVGQIEHAARTADKIKGWGKVFGQALASEHGPTIRVMMADNGPGGVSVDVDKVKDADVEMIYAEVEGNPFAKPETTIFHRGRIRGATLVAFPAFVEAKLAFTNQEVVTAAAEPSCGCNAPLTAASHTITIPDLPPAHWFNEPTDVEIDGALTITDEGRVFGLVAPADTTHRNVKTKVPRSLDFSRFHKGETIVEGGSRVVTGVITADCGHALTEGYGTLQNRIDHYDNSCSVLANVRVGYDRTGAIWVAGALNQGADPRQVAQAFGCTLSLDVQPHPDRPGVREFISAHLVPVPGFPLARTQASVQYNDGLITAAAVPIRRVGEPASRVDLFEVVSKAKMVLAQSIGRDPVTRKRELAAQLKRR